MEQIILPSPILEFTWLVINGFMEENGPVWPLPKVKFSPIPIQKVHKKFEFSQCLAAKYKQNFSHYKKYLWKGEYIPWNIRIQIQTTRKLLG